MKKVLSLIETSGRRFSAVYLLALIFVVFGTTQDQFLTGPTIRIVLGQQVTVAILALAVLVPLVTGAFDLSVGAMFGFSLVIVTKLQQHGFASPGVDSLIAIAACMVVGTISGILIVRFNIGSFIATLGMGQVLTAATLLISDNEVIGDVFPHSFHTIAQSRFLDLPIVIFYLLAISLVLWFLLTFTPLGRRLYATGENKEAARLAGIPTDRLTMLSLTASGGMAGLAGVLYAAQYGVFDNSSGAPLLFPAFAAVFFGATQFSGRANVWGTILAVYVLAFGVQGILLAFPSSQFWVSPAFSGVALLIAVGFASRRRKVRVQGNEDRDAGGTAVGKPSKPPGADLGTAAGGDLPSPNA